MAGRAIRYALWFLAVLGTLSLVLFLTYSRVRNAPAPAGELLAKGAWYQLHAGTLDLIYLGDSRTYCAMHPEVLDPLLGTGSYNLSHWAHWLPTQYPQVEDLAPLIPTGTTVVWSVGGQNFGAGEILAKYPIGLRNVPMYLRIGVPLGQMAGDLADFNPLTFLYSRRGAMFDRVSALAGAPLAAGRQADVGGSGEELRRLEQEVLARPGVVRAEVQAPQGKPVAVAQFMRGGGYLLEELDPAYFLARQRSGGNATEPAPTAGVFPEPSRWALFLAMLDLFRAQNIHVVVNVLEEAPHSYRDLAQKRQERAFMDGPVRREVEARGFAFVRADLDQLTDAEYFDYNHLNARGVRKYSRLLAEVLRPLLHKAGRP